MKRPNIVYVVMDAMRTDAINETTTLQRLATKNVAFEQAITPATWSLPAHASLLTGKYPHVHGVTQSGDKPESLDLVKTLNDREYSTYGVSGNPFFSQNQGFDGSFDQFWYTPLMWFPDGIDISNYHDHINKIMEIVRDRKIKNIRYLVDFLTEVGRGHILQNLGNLIYAYGVQLQLEARGIDWIRHPFVDNSLAYQPKTNTEIIKEIIEIESTRESPFFIFANYMDTHDPYDPPKRFRTEKTANLSWKEIKQLNKELSSWEFLKTEDNSDSLEILRELYYGEARSVDTHIRELIRTLESHSLQEDTIVILTSDHGENLGETDYRGRARTGHVSSFGRSLIEVPLIIVSPGSESKTLTEPVSTKDIATAIIENTLFDKDGITPSAVFPNDGVVLCEAPARGGKETMVESHPDLSTKIISEETAEDNVLGRLDGWQIIRTEGEDWAWKNGESVDYQSTPEKLRYAVNEAHDLLVKQRPNEELSQSAIDRLKDLGYV